MDNCYKLDRDVQVCQNGNGRKVYFLSGLSNVTTDLIACRIFKSLQPFHSDPKIEQRNRFMDIAEVGSKRSH